MTDPGQRNLFVTPPRAVPGLDEAIAGNVSVAAWTFLVAHRHKVDTRPRSEDAFAGAISRLSDAETELDEVERLLLAVRRAGLITTEERAALHAAHLRQIG